MSQCAARVPLGTSSYAARNTERQCKRPATHGNYCHAHRGRNVTPIDPAKLAEVRGALAPLVQNDKEKYRN